MFNFDLEIEGDFSPLELWKLLEPLNINMIILSNSVYIYGQAKPCRIARILNLCNHFGGVKGKVSSIAIRPIPPKGGDDMTLNCSAIIDNPEEKSNFAKQLEALGIKPRIVGNIVYVEYKGYNIVRFNSIIEAFEGKNRHSIDTHGV